VLGKLYEEYMINKRVLLQFVKATAGCAFIIATSVCIGRTMIGRSPVRANPDLRTRTINLALASSAQSNPNPKKLIYPNGKPAVDATLVQYVIHNGTHTVTKLVSRPDRQGIVETIPQTSPEYSNSAVVLRISSPTGTCFYNFGHAGTAICTLRSFTRVRFHVVDTRGNSVKGVRICPAEFYAENDYGTWNPAIDSPWTQTTDANGYATLGRLPQGYLMQIQLLDDGYFGPDTTKSIQLSTTAVTPDITLHVSLSASVSGQVECSTANQPVSGIHVLAIPKDSLTENTEVTTNNIGQFTISGLQAGTYNIAVKDDAAYYSTWISTPITVTLSDGENSTSNILSLKPGGLIEGRVTDRDSGKPIPNVFITGTSDSDPTLANGQLRPCAVTGPDGTYRLRVVPGRVSVNPILPVASGDSRQQIVTLSEGQTESIDFKIATPPRPTIVNGYVLDPNRQGVDGAVVLIFDQYMQPSEVTTDSQGRFKIDAPGLRPDSTIMAYSGSQATLTPLLYYDQSHILISVAPNGFCYCDGQTRDLDFKMIGNIGVTLVRWVNGKAQDIEHARSNASGQYIFGPVFGNVDYSVRVDCPGYETTSSEHLDVQPDQPDHFTVIVRPTDTFAGGTVVDAYGKPIAGVVISYGISLAYSTTTDANGQFMIRDIPNRPRDVFIQPPTGRVDEQTIKCNIPNNVIVYNPPRFLPAM